MNKSDSKDLKNIFVILLFLIPVIIGVVAPFWILPENCYLFGNPDGPFSCDAIPNDCCGNMMAVTYAQIIFWLGIGISVASVIILGLKEAQKDYESDVEIFNKNNS